MDDATHAFWERCCDEHPRLRAHEGPPEAWGFGADAGLADRLGALVVEGVKTATCSAVWEYEHGGEDLPRVGQLGIVLDGRGAPLCLIETIEVRVVPFDEVSAEHARAEGEGDRSLESWREAHWAFFSAFLPRIGLEPARDMPLVCERFRVLVTA